MRVCLTSTYPPRACGLGTFAERLRHDLIAAPGVAGVDVVAVVRGDADPTAARPEVMHRLEQDDLGAYRRAADVINRGGYDVVSIQHEFGIYGGPAGLYVAELTGLLEAPVVTTLHTVLGEPTAEQHRAMLAIADTSAALVVLSEAALPLLAAQQLGPVRTAVIPHGVPDVPLTDPAMHKAALGLQDRFVILTFGLLSPNKGVEQVVEALPTVVSRHPQVCYLVLGATHPEVRRVDGEAYRRALEARVAQLGLDDHVRFIDRYADDDDLLAHLQACDVYVTPYGSVEQISSGTLAYAVGVGRAVVSTPYRYARALLADGVGRLVDFHDVDDMSAVLTELVGDDEGRARLQAKAHETGRRMTWPSVARQCARLFADLSMAHRLRRALPDPDLARRPRVPSLDRLEALTDDVGVFQHASYGIPDRAHGYTTDDNARALAAVVLHARRHADDRADRLATTYLSYLAHAQTRDGRFRNVLAYDRRWLDEVGTGDTLGQAVWGLGTATSHGSTVDLRDRAWSLLDAALPAVAELLPVRSVAYALCGLTAVLEHRADAEVGRLTDDLVARLLEAFAEHRREDWHWCDQAFTYANSKIPEALLQAGSVRHRPEWVQAGCDALDLVLAQTVRGGVLAPIGNEGWYPRDGVRAVYGQQPVEAGYTAQACAMAHRLTGRRRYEEAGQAAIAWLLGRNVRGASLYDPATGACADGLDRHGISRNTGAESVICALLGMLAMPPGVDLAQPGADQPASRVA